MPLRQKGQGMPNGIAKAPRLLANVRASFSWSTKGSKRPTEKDEHVVSLDIPECPSPDEILGIVKHAFNSRSLLAQESQICIERLRWSIGNIRQPNRCVRARRMKALAGAVLTLTDQAGANRVATVRAHAGWEASWHTWRENDRNKAKPANQPGQMTPPQNLRWKPNSLLLQTSPSPQFQANPMQVVIVLPNILSPFGHLHPLYQGTAPLTHQNMNYMQAVM